MVIVFPEKSKTQSPFYFPKKYAKLYLQSDLLYCISAILQKTNTGGIAMKGYAISEGYMGYVDGEYMLFACESEYREYLED